MIPQITLDILGPLYITRTARIRPAGNYYAVHGSDLNDLEVLILRLDDTRALGAPERAAWVDRLRKLLTDAQGL